MKDRKNLIYIIAACLIVLGYAYYSFFLKNAHKSDVESKLEAILGTKVYLADSTYMASDGSFFSMESAKYPLMVEYHDNFVCTSCTQRGFQKWDELLSQVDTSKYSFALIIHSGSNDYDAFFEMVDSLGLNFKCYRDPDMRFLADNPAFATTDKFYYAFLLNGNREVEVAGLPIYNNKLWDLYKARINAIN